MKKRIPKKLNFGEESFFDQIREKLVKEVNMEYLRFHSGLKPSWDFGKQQKASKKKGLTRNFKEKFLDDSSF
jgi:hypothetical protein